MTRNIHQTDQAELRRYQILEFIQYYTWRHETSPPYRVIAKHFRVATATIQSDLKWLRDNGYTVTIGTRIYVNRCSKHAHVVQSSTD